MYWLWLLIDRIISRCLGIEPLRKDRMGIISTQLRQYRGQPVQIDDSIIIYPRDLLIELHMNNAWFLHSRRKLTGTTNEERWNVSTAFSEDLRLLASQIAEGKFSPRVKALHAKTLLHSPMRRLGFTVVESRGGLGRRLTTFYLNNLRQVYYFGEDKERAFNRRPPALVEAWMSRPRLLEKYLLQ